MVFMTHYQEVWDSKIILNNKSTSLEDVGTFFYFGKLGKVKNKALSLAPMVCVDKKRKKIQKCKLNLRRI